MRSTQLKGIILQSGRHGNRKVLNNSLPNSNVYAFLRSVAQDVQLLSVQDTCNYNRKIERKST